MPTPPRPVTDLTILTTGTLRITDHSQPLGYRRIIIQRTSKGSGQIPYSAKYDLQIKPYQKPGNPNSPAQQSRRARFADAVTAWHDATDAERQRSNKTAKKRRITNFNAYISNYIKLHPIT